MDALQQKQLLGHTLGCPALLPAGSRFTAMWALSSNTPFLREDSIWVDQDRTERD